MPVVSGSATGSSDVEMETDAPNLDVFALMRRKEQIDDQMKELFDVLKSHNVTLEEALVDHEGYPRSDIDVSAVRTARSEISRLRTDLREIMDQLADALAQVHGRGAASVLQAPIARIEFVDAGSPADMAGLKPDDLVLSFGSLNEKTMTALKDLAGVVQENIGKSIPLSVRRDADVLQLNLIPQQWSGHGTVGCKFLPVPKPSAAPAQREEGPTPQVATMER